MTGEKILLVDDEEDIRDILSISLSDLGYQVITAENGEQALNIFRKAKPSILLTDIRMPGMDGIELLKKVKQEDPDTEVIMITGHGDMDLAIKSLKYEATDFVTKPINDEILQIALKRALERLTMRERLRDYTQNLERLVREQSEKLVRAERIIAVNQVVEGIASAARTMAEDMNGSVSYFNEMPCLVSIYNRECEVVAVNQLYLERIGNSVGRNAWEIHAGGLALRERCPIFRTFDTGKGQCSREMVINEQGREIPVIVHTAPIRNGEREVELVLEISAEIGEVHRLQEELRITQLRYQQLFNESPCYISVQDKDLRIFAANRKFIEDFGDNIGASCFEVYKRRKDPCPSCPVTRTFEEGKSRQHETIVTSLRGEQKNVLIHTAPIRSISGEIAFVMEMSTDITEFRRLQDQLSGLGLLIGSVSHGMKGLLTGLDGGIYRVDVGLERGDSERIREGWEAVKLTTSRIRGMALNLLYYAKEKDLSRQRITLSDFASDLAVAFEQKIGDQQIEFVLQMEDSSCTFEADPGALSSALMNILENAMDACSEDSAKRGHKIVFGTRNTEAHVVFEIQDNGIGMSKEITEKLFSPSFSSKGRKGTGLGLFLSNEIVRRHGGAVTVESTPVEGSRFIVTIPNRHQEKGKTVGHPF
ncbi:MAG: response regulator [Desulfobacteraceae bacterium]|nr:MAG: response regulator [Desulfobacteraceae bacterium]